MAALGGAGVGTAAGAWLSAPTMDLFGHDELSVGGAFTTNAPATAAPSAPKSDGVGAKGGGCFAWVPVLTPGGPACKAAAGVCGTSLETFMVVFTS